MAGEIVTAMPDDMAILRRLPRDRWPAFLAKLPEERKEAILANLKAAVAAAKYAQDPVGYIQDVLGEKLWSQQKVIAEAVRDNIRVSIPACHAPGKEGFVDEPILTTVGWKTHGTIRVGDITFADDGTQTRVLGVFPQGIKPIYRVAFNDGTHLDVGREHLWKVHLPYQGNEKATCSWCGDLFKLGRTPKLFCDRHDGVFDDLRCCRVCLKAKPVAASFTKDRQDKTGWSRTCRSCRLSKRQRKPHKALSRPYWEVVTTEDLLNYGGPRPVGKRRAEIPVVKPVQFDHVDAGPMDPYLIGVFLGDGSHANGLGGFTSADSEIVEAVRQRYEVSKRIKQYDYYACGAVRHLRASGVTEGPVWEVRVPPKFLWNDVETRLAVLQGLMDTDGTVDVPSMTTEFTSSSPGLVEDVEFLVRSLGGITSQTVKENPTYTYKDEKKTGRPCYRLFFSVPVCPFRLQRKAERWESLTAVREKGLKRLIESIEPIGDKEAVCIRVEHPTGTYVAKDFIVTHNTHLAARITCWWIGSHPIGTAQVVTTANTFRQVRNLLWPHIRRIHASHNLPGHTNLTEWWVGQELAAYGFCYDDQTEILTNEGWKRFDALRGDEPVATRSPTGEFEWQKPTAYTNELYEGPMVLFKNKKLDICVTPNHRMYVRRPFNPALKDRGLEFKEAGWFAEGPLRNSYLIPATSIWQGEDPGPFVLEGTDPNKVLYPGEEKWTEEQIRLLANYYEDHPAPLPLPMVEMVHRLRKTPRHITRKAQKLGISAGLPQRSRTRHCSPDISMAADVWAAFLGLYLSEGWCNRADSRYRNDVGISQSPRSPHLQAIKEILDRTGLDWHYNISRPNAGNFITSHKNLGAWLRTHCYTGPDNRSWNKKMPESVYTWTPELLNVIFDYMMRGDGHIEKNGFRRYLTTSKTLASDLLEVLQKAGHDGAICEHWPRNGVSKRMQYRVSARRDDWHGIPTPQVIDYRGQIGCVTVPNGTLYVRRNGKPVWCGNSASDADPEAVQGIHASHLLIIVDEAAGIPHVIGQAFESLLSSGDVHILLLGNPPVDEEGTWFQHCCESDLWHTVQLPASKTPNWTGEATEICTACPASVPEHHIAEHLVSKRWAEELAVDYGEESPIFIAKVKAEFPQGVAAKTIPFSWVEAALDNREPWSGSSVRLGVDIASDGGDEVVVALANGNTLSIMYSASGSENADAVQVAGEILQRIREAEILNTRNGNDDKVRVKIDAVGVGWGVASTLENWGLEGKHSSVIVPVKAGEKATESDRYSGVRAEMWWAGRQALAPQKDDKGNPLPPRIRLAVDRRTASQLTAPNYKTDTQGRISIERKVDMKKRGVNSPDRAEAILLAIYEPPVEAPKRKVRVIL